MVALASMASVEEKDEERALLIIRKARGYLSEIGYYYARGH
jgi:hypothetical protein